MKRLFGLCLFWLGIGMTVFMLLPTTFWSVVVTFACIIITRIVVTNQIVFWCILLDEASDLVIVQIRTEISSLRVYSQI